EIFSIVMQPTRRRRRGLFVGCMTIRLLTYLVGAVGVVAGGSVATGVSAGGAVPAGMVPDTGDTAAGTCTGSVTAGCVGTGVAMGALLVILASFFLASNQSVYAVLLALSILSWVKGRFGSRANTL